MNAGFGDSEGPESGSSTRRVVPARAALILLALFLFGGCGPTAERAGRAALSVWAHAGQAGEREVLRAQVARFNRAQTDVAVSLTFIPEGTYNGQVQAAALAGRLPDVLEFDGPYLYNYAWQGRLRRLDALLPAALRRELLPSIIAQGTYRDGLYSVASFDSGLGLYARRSAVKRAGLRLPRSPAEAWSVDEFDTLLARLSSQDADGAVLDLKLNYRGEWFVYGFSPAIQSAGGDLIDRGDYRHAGGVLNGPAAVAALARIQGWIGRGYVDPNLDDAAFVQGRVALSWVGHWEYDRYRQAWGDDLAVVPLPDFGHGTRTGQGSWNWGITVQCDEPRAAMRFIAFLLRPEEVLAMTAANGAVPATRRALAQSPRYGPGRPLNLLAQQLLRGYAVPRPATPGYPIISSAFARAFGDIRNGLDVRAALDRAAALIDQDIRDNHGYPDVALAENAGAR